MIKDYNCCIVCTLTKKLCGDDVTSLPTIFLVFFVSHCCGIIPTFVLRNYSIQLFHCVMFYSFRTPLIKLNKLSEETGMYTNTDTKVCLIHLCRYTCVLMVHV